VQTCVGCGWRVEHAVEAAAAEPAHCGECNP
jgi:hypothetical protein